MPLVAPRVGVAAGASSTTTGTIIISNMTGPPGPPTPGAWVLITRRTSTTRTWLWTKTCITTCWRSSTSVTRCCYRSTHRTSSKMCWDIPQSTRPTTILSRNPASTWLWSARRRRIKRARPARAPRKGPSRASLRVIVRGKVRRREAIRRRGGLGQKSIKQLLVVRMTIYSMAILKGITWKL